MNQTLASGDLATFDSLLNQMNSQIEQAQQLSSELTGSVSGFAAQLEGLSRKVRVATSKKYES